MPPKIIISFVTIVGSLLFCHTTAQAQVPSSCSFTGYSFECNQYEGRWGSKTECREFGKGKWQFSCGPICTRKDPQPQPQFTPCPQGCPATPDYEQLCADYLKNRILGLRCESKPFSSKKACETARASDGAACPGPSDYYVCNIPKEEICRGRGIGPCDNLQAVNTESSTNF